MSPGSGWCPGDLGYSSPLFSGPRNPHHSLTAATGPPLPDSSDPESPLSCRLSLPSLSVEGLAAFFGLPLPVVLTPDWPLQLLAALPLSHQPTFRTSLLPP